MSPGAAYSTVEEWQRAFAAWQQAETLRQQQAAAAAATQQVPPHQPPPSAPATNGASEPNHRVFRYFDGAEWVWGDPIRIHDALTYHLEEPNRVLQATRSPQPSIAYPATEKLVQAVAAALEMQPYDKRTGGGADWKCCLDALNQFLDYEADLKKAGAPEPTQSSAAAGATPSGSTATTTPVSSVYG